MRDIAWLKCPTVKACACHGSGAWLCGSPPLGSASCVLAGERPPGGRAAGGGGRASTPPRQKHRGTRSAAAQLRRAENLVLKHTAGVPQEHPVLRSRSRSHERPGASGAASSTLPAAARSPSWSPLDSPTGGLFYAERVAPDELPAEEASTSASSDELPAGEAATSLAPDELPAREAATSIVPDEPAGEEAGSSIEYGGPAYDSSTSLERVPEPPVAEELCIRAPVAQVAEPQRRRAVLLPRVGRHGKALPWGSRTPVPVWIREPEPPSTRGTDPRDAAVSMSGSYTEASSPKPHVILVPRDKSAPWYAQDAGGRHAREGWRPRTRREVQEGWRERRPGPRLLLLPADRAPEVGEEAHWSPGPERLAAAEAAYRWIPPPPPTFAPRPEREVRKKRPRTPDS
jgi:hypothetical protein